MAMAAWWCGCVRKAAVCAKIRVWRGVGTPCFFCCVKIVLIKKKKGFLLLLPISNYSSNYTDNRDQSM